MRSPWSLAALLVFAIACRTTADRGAGAHAESGAPGEPAAERAEPIAIGYPSGPWWQHDLQSLVLAGEHILIAHRDAQPIAELIWTQPQSRTREQARQKAWALYTELGASPARFGERARRESDEPLSAATGGSLGVFRPINVPQPFVDAFGHIDEGEVSRPVETPQGFHVLRRLPLPAAAELSLARIVIKFGDSIGWRRMDRAVPERMREQARELAERLSREAQVAPAEFGRLALLHSDADDAQREGAIGTLSSHEVVDGDLRVLFTVGATLPIGGVSAVIELASGAHVLTRLPPAPRVADAASVITIGYADSQFARVSPNATRSRADAERLVDELAEQLRSRPERFDAIRGTHCDAVLCDGVTSFYRKGSLTALERAVERLAVNEVSGKPIDTPLGYMIVRREDARKHPVVPPTTTFAFPGGDRWGLSTPTGE